MEDTESKPIGKTLSERLKACRREMGIPKMSVGMDISPSQIQRMIGNTVGITFRNSTIKRADAFLKRNGF